MSVTKDGIRGYEYQYKVTVLASLLYQEERPKIFVEKINNEDVVLHLKNGSVEKTIQIQIKHEDSQLDMKKLAEWLSHFEDRSSQANFLQRVIDGTDDIALFVTRSRSERDTVPLTADIKKLEPHKSLIISNEQSETFSEALLKLRYGKTSLQTTRGEFSKTQGLKIKKDNNLDQILENVIIWEQLDDEKVEQKITERLVKSITSLHRILTTYYLDSLRL
jgi:hypothetical protein